MTINYPIHTLNEKLKLPALADVDPIIEYLFLQEEKNERQCS